MNSNKTRRAACDRCRDQKLRCPRVNSTSEQCARCLRAHAICVTSSTRPNGRPRKTPFPATDRTPDGPGVKANTPLCDLSPSLDAHPELIDPSACSSAPETLNLGSDGMSENQTSLQIQTVPDTTDLFDFGLLGGESNGGFSALDIESDITRAEGNFLESMGRYDNSHSAGWTMQGPGDMDVDPQRIQLAAVVDPRIQLSNLSSNITQQLNRVRTYSWHPSHLQADCLAKSQGIDQNPLAQVLQCTSQLATVLEQLLCTSSFPEANSSTSHKPTDPAAVISTSATAPSIGNPPGTSTILLILATWLQLIELYDELFGHICDALQQMPADTITAFRHPVGMIGPRIPGMEFMQGDLSIRIMIEVINHQLKSVEVSLGLPDEYCIVRHNGGISGKTSTIGLFARGDVGPNELLQAVMRMPDAPSKLESLRDKIKTVQGIVGMHGS